MKEDIIEFVCVVDKLNIPMDYGEGDYCIRLMGFDRNNLHESTESVKTYFIDIDYDFFIDFESVSGYKYVMDHLDNFISNKCYVLLKFYPSNDKHACFYRSFLSIGEDKFDFKYITIKTLSFQYNKNANIKNQILFNKFIKNTTELSGGDYFLNINTNSRVILKAYQVGQGMCSLIHNDDEGFLIDCGAGTPIRRINYDLIKNNKLSDDIGRLNKVKLILSHLDSDHYRILSWDANILRKIDEIYIPSGVSGVFCNEEKIKKLIRYCDYLKIDFNSVVLESYRTSPHNGSTNKNDNALITLISSCNSKVLYPADYSYSNIERDKNICISSLSNLKYDFLSVPHHGDDESRNNIFPCKKNMGMAFFSAGNNKKYNHPRLSSIDAHEKINYIPIVDNELDDIEFIIVPL